MKVETQKLGFYIITLLFLILLICGISYAVYKFSFTGTRENSITSGNVSLSYEESTNISLTNQYPETDLVGSAKADSLTFSVSANIIGEFDLKYDIGISLIEEGKSLTADYIKFNLKKDNIYLLGTTDSTGITIGSRKNISGNNNLISSYAIDSDFFNQTGQKTYTIKAWISEDYEPIMIDVGSDGTQGKEVQSETFKFKISVIGSQI